MITKRTRQLAWPILTVLLATLLLMQGCQPIDYSALEEGPIPDKVMAVEQFQVIDSEGLPRTCVIAYAKAGGNSGTPAISCDWELAP